MGVPTAIGLVLVSSDGLRGCRTAQQVGELSLARDTNDRTSLHFRPIFHECLLTGDPCEISGHSSPPVKVQAMCASPL
jgi:hypothetical protein